jgi:hypothetical protein
LGTALFVHVLCKAVPTPPAVMILAAIVIPLGLAIDLYSKRRPLRTELLPLQ